MLLLSPPGRYALLASPAPMSRARPFSRLTVSQAKYDGVSVMYQVLSPSRSLNLSVSTGPFKRRSRLVRCLPYAFTDCSCGKEVVRVSAASIPRTQQGARIQQQIKHSKPGCKPSEIATAGNTPIKLVFDAKNHLRCNVLCRSEHPEPSAS